MVQGVQLYKEGKHNEAMSLYNKALDIDSENVEAFVARGAMYVDINVEITFNLINLLSICASFLYIFGYIYTIVFLVKSTLFQQLHF